MEKPRGAGLLGSRPVSRSLVTSFGAAFFGLPKGLTCARSSPTFSTTAGSSGGSRRSRARPTSATSVHAGQSADEGAVVQLLLRPAPPAIRRRALARARKLRRGEPRSLWPAPVRFGAELAEEGIDIFVPGGPQRHGSAPIPSLPPDPWAVEQAKLIEEKSTEPFLDGSLRLAVSRPL